MLHYKLRGFGGAFQSRGIKDRDMNCAKGTL
jgi:hypothetical protein